jgi:phosphatidylserine decarboxylase
MDPFVVISLGKKTYRTPRVRHDLNPVYKEKLVFQVANHEVKYSVRFEVSDQDRFSNHDFVGSVTLPLDQLTAVCGEPDPETGLYKLPEIPDATDEPTRRKRIRNPLSRTSSAQSLSRMAKPSLRKEHSANSLHSGISDDFAPPDANRLAPTSNPQAAPANGNGNGVKDSSSQSQPADDPEMRQYTLPLQLKNQEKWETKHSPVLYIRAKYMPYMALRQQFWRAMLKQYDADDSGKIDKIELTTMLDNLGSTLHESTIDGFFSRFGAQNSSAEVPSLTFDQAVICLEDQLQKTMQKQKSLGSSLRSYLTIDSSAPTPGDTTPGDQTPLNMSSQTNLVPAIQTEELGNTGEEGGAIDANDLSDERGEEHVIEIRECPICHQPRLNKKSDADIITHIATCASQDWREVNNIVMAGFVTSSQAQRKWYSKVINKVRYGGYKLGANSANILVQDRITGQINEEKMSVYVRLGIRLLYKGLKSRDMEGRRSMCSCFCFADVAFVQFVGAVEYSLTVF